MTTHSKYVYFFFLTLLILLLSVSSAWSQRNIPPKPSKQTSVYDSAGLLNTEEKNQLEQKLINYADSTTTQIVVVLIKSLEGEYIGTFAAEWAHKWGIGQSKIDNGVLLMAAIDDRDFWITTGYGLEEFLTDAESSMIYNRIIKPEFQKERYFKGLDEGTTAIMQILSGEFEANPKNAEDGFPMGVLVFLFIIILFVIIASKRGGGNNRGGKGRSNDGWLFDAILLSSMGRGGGRGHSGGFGSGGGGFSGGFGGGGFGGGGAGGKW